ncbi:MAG: hypothetical protein K8I02_00775, partial [Candidatus Methylomirabilis sp.]|nr:hypothetical protein [Deltaproteobacteria bacterium]
PGNAEARAHLRKLQDEIRIERDMEELSSDHFKVKFEGAANFESGRLVLEGLERAYRKLAQDLDYEPEREVTALLYTDRGFHEVIHAPDWTGAIFDGKIRIPLGGLDRASKSEVESLVLHEYTHAVVHHMTKGGCPAWLNEGLALYQSERDKFNQKAVFRFRIRHRGQDVLALSDMEDGFLGFDGETARAAYNQAFNVVAYLVSVYGYSEVRRLLLAFGAGRTVEEGVAEVLGVPYDEFEGAFQRYMFNWEE